MLDFPTAPDVGQKYPQPAVAGQPVYVWDGEKWGSKGGSTTVGGQPSDANPAMDGVAFVGLLTVYGRGDHVHPSDTSRAPVASPTITGTLTTPALTVTGNTSFGVLDISTLAVSGAAQLAGVTATALSVTGNSAIAGAITAQAKGQHFGNATGAVVPTAVTRADANIVLYDISAENWAGIGTDQNGNMWFRTGLSGAPAPAFHMDPNQTVVFQKSPIMPTPPPGSNNTKIATTAFVLNRTPAGTFLPLSGGTLTGNLTVIGDMYQTYAGNAAMGIIRLNSAGTAYLINDGANYSFAGGHLYGGQGRCWGSNDFATPVSSGRMVHAGDREYITAAGLEEPYAGAVITGQSAMQGQQFTTIYRYRYMQVITTGWYTIGYV